MNYLIHSESFAPSWAQPTLSAKSSFTSSVWEPKDQTDFQKSLKIQFAQNISIQRTVANTRDKVLIRQPRIAVFVFWMLKSHQNRSKSDKKTIFRFRFFCPKKSIPISGYRLFRVFFRWLFFKIFPSSFSPSGTMPWSLGLIATKVRWRYILVSHPITNCR